MDGAIRNHEQNVKRLKTKFSLSPFINLITLFILGVLLWGMVWCTWGPNWAWNGVWFRISAIAALGWFASYAFNKITNMPAMLAALLVGVLARNLGYLDMRNHLEVDIFLRKVYPVVILGKASLGWDVYFMKTHWKRIFALGMIPWTLEVLVLATCTFYLLDFPIVWGLLSGSIYASLSCAVLMPSITQQAKNEVSKRNWPQLVCTAGGIDTALSVGVYGLIFSYIFIPTNEPYRITKAALTVFIGVALGISWGTIAKYLPNKQDYYVAELRVLFVLIGGLFCNFFTLHFGWGGVAGVAVLACNMTAAHHWRLLGWPLNNNPASTAYRVMWATLEPILFALTGTFFVFDDDTLNTIRIGFGILAICLAVRVMTAIIVCWDFNLNEKIYACFTCIPKTIVEAVLCPLTLTSLLTMSAEQTNELKYAEDIIRLTVQAIVITTPLGYLLTHYLGPILLRKSVDVDG